MPYIDKDKLIKELSTMYKSPTSAEDFMTVGYDHAIADVVVTVHEQPTVDVVDKEQYDRLLENATIISEALNKYQTADVVERKRGKWKLNKDGNWACPFCEFDPYHDNMKGMNYCPNCGADMRGETEDDNN